MVLSYGWPPLKEFSSKMAEPKYALRELPRELLVVC